eukprot:1158303-Pelagomonas_calceolata.AAC.7
MCDLAQRYKLLASNVVQVRQCQEEFAVGGIPVWQASKHVCGECVGRGRGRTGACIQACTQALAQNSRTGGPPSAHRRKSRLGRCACSSGKPEQRSASGLQLWPPALGNSKQSLGKELQFWPLAVGDHEPKEHTWIAALASCCRQPGAGGWAGWQQHPRSLCQHGEA